ncbi:MAG: hypothetical protein KDC31_00595 [Saprospiraceae bacterium]|jgi:hypothetical protein|nr:hypothetical protein [Candidatus Parvibacillus calidus]MBX2938131.1 hypothetical protein [Saprospiraceae bacterium]MBX7048753.1 hypothetical protein [Chitinophagales bacterium]MBX7180116.1 hypothetical protein [Saprospiraceae bacterium]MCB0589763.1 hypothetical protein [Saprospiraceae bacterium]
MKLYTLLLCSLLALTACGQTKEKDKNEKIVNTPKTQKIMDLNKISNTQVKQAIEALQNNDKTAWYSHFTDNAVFSDDGRKSDFKTFFDNAFSHKERFLDIDKVENDGKDIYGNFYAGQWGTFRVYFKFHQQADGKFNRIDIGQAN